MTKDTDMTIKEVREEIEKIASDKNFKLIQKTKPWDSDKAISYDLLLKRQSCSHVVLTKIGSPGKHGKNSLVTSCYDIVSVYKMLEEINNSNRDVRVTPQKIERSNWTPIFHGPRAKLGYSFSFKNRLSIEVFLIALIDYINAGEILSLEDWRYLTEDIEFLDDLYKKVKEEKNNLIQEEIRNSVPREEPDEYMEGEKRLIWSQYYERNRKARDIVLSNADYRCHLCCRTMSEIYGDEIDGKETKGLMHAHHIVPISQADGEHSVNPETDLIAVCPSCHAVLHIGGNKEAIPVEQFKKLREKIVANLQNQENVDKMNIAFNEMHKR